jgi:cytochrome c-type biogenesis protein CcmH/NrfG
MSQYAAALLIKPDYAAALDGLAWILSTNPNPEFRNGIEAVKMAEQACVLTSHTNASMLKTLAAAHAETGRFADAITALQAAIKLQDHQNPGSTNGVAMLKIFQQGQPWREQ